MDKFNDQASDEVLEKTINALAEKNIKAFVVETEQEAKDKVFEIIPEGVEVMDNTSITLDTIGVRKELLESGKYNPVRAVLNDQEADPRLKKKLGAAAEYTIGSVHAVTEDGSVLIASNSGSNLPTYAYGSDHVIWVVGTQKIVKDFNEGMKRIYEYVLPLESERAKKAYGTSGSNVSKMLVVNKEVKEGRINIIFIKESIGF